MLSGRLHVLRCAPGACRGSCGHDLAKRRWALPSCWGGIGTLSTPTTLGVTYCHCMRQGHTVAGYACQPGFSPDGRYVISGDGEGKLWFWDWKTCKPYRTIKAHEGVCIGAAWHPLETSKVCAPCFVVLGERSAHRVLLNAKLQYAFHWLPAMPLAATGIWLCHRSSARCHLLVFQPRSLLRCNAGQDIIVFCACAGMKVMGEMCLHFWKPVQRQGT